MGSRKELEGYPDTGARYAEDVGYLLLRNAPTAAMTNIAIGLLTFWAVPSTDTVWIWLLVIVSLIRFIPSFLYRRTSWLRQNNRVLYALALVAITMQGMAWGYASHVLYHTTTDIHRFYLIAIVCGMVGGAIHSLSPSFVGFMCFSLPATLPLVITMLLDSSGTFRYAGAMGAVFIGGVVIFSWRSCQAHWELLTSRKKLKQASEELASHKHRLEQIVKERTEELRQSRENYRRLTEEINDVIYELDSDGIIQYISPVITSVLGYEAEELIGEHYTMLFVPDELERVRTKFKRVMSGEIFPTDYRVFDKTGKEHWVRASSRAIVRDGKPAGLRGVLTNIEAEKRAEKEKVELVRKIGEVRKFEAIATLAGGVAHDFNNLLMGIQGRNSLIAHRLHESDPMFEHTQAIEEYVKSAAHLTSQLLGTVRGGKYDPVPCDLNELVVQSAMMFGRARKELQVKVIPAEIEAVAEVDRRQVEQVLLNMFVNAWQAMPGGGELTIRLQCIILDEAFCMPYGASAGNYVHISVTDNGIGMDEELTHRIFDPFFTTKEKERGTGLGLSSAQGIIKNHNGFISVYSEVGHGTTFNIYLPNIPGRPQKIVRAEQALLEGVGTVLLVDDEDLVLEVGKDMLEGLGYTALVAKGGEKALSIMEQHGEEVQLVILDMIMPSMDGGETFDAIRKIFPDKPVLLSSGYAINGKAEEIMQRGCNGFIQKPFNLAEFSRKIRSVLEGKFLV